jgi:hypothetical protein
MMSDRRQALAGLSVLLWSGAGVARETRSPGTGLPGSVARRSTERSVALDWCAVVTDAMTIGRSPPTVASRALSMVYEATYNAWACFDRDARQTLPGLPRVRDAAIRDAMASLAVSAAARDVLSNLYADQAERFADQWQRHKARWWNEAGVVAAPVALQVGELCASRLLQQRLQDGSNQTGDLASGAYADYTGYKPVNSPDLVVDPMRWQPLRVSNGQGDLVDQKCTTPHWGLVRPFALPAGSSFRPSLSRLAPSVAEVQDVLRRSATLGDLEKANADFWAGRPGSPPPPGIWNQIAAQVAAEDGQTLSQDVKMLFLLGQAMLDTSIAVWDTKVFYDTVRPITWIRNALQGQMVWGWAGPGAGTQFIRAEDWRPYQPETFVTPPFQEIVSGHSAFSAAAAACLGAWRGDSFELRAMVPAGSSEVEPGAPSRDVVLRWSGLRDAANAAGLSRRQGGITSLKATSRAERWGSAWPVACSIAPARCSDRAIGPSLRTSLADPAWRVFRPSGHASSLQSPASPGNPRSTSGWHFRETTDNHEEDRETQPFSPSYPSLDPGFCHVPGSLAGMVGQRNPVLSGARLLPGRARGPIAGLLLATGAHVPGGQRRPRGCVCGPDPGDVDGSIRQDRRKRASHH